MAGFVDKEAAPLPTPYNKDTFQKRLNQFHHLIRHLTLQDVEATPEERRQQIAENLRFDQFSDSIHALFGAEVRSNDLKTLYRKISTNPDAKVDWGELFGFFKTDKNEPEFITEEVSVFMVTKRFRVGEAAGEHRRRDVIQAMKLVPALDGFISASRKGTVCIWSSKLKLQSTCELKGTAWVTGVDYLVNLRRVIICTERSICIWDYRAKNTSQSVFQIKPLDNSPQCICWIPVQDRLMEDTVLFGDDQGYVNVLTLKPLDLAAKSSGKNKSSKKISDAELMSISPEKLSIKIIRRKIHQQRVVKVAYYPELRCFASASPGCGYSFVLEELGRLSDCGDVRGLNAPKGVSAFTYCVKANIIATGGVDKVIRIWHPHIFTRPTGKLVGHLFTIVSITCNESEQHLISLSAARVFRVWDLHTLTSLQVFTDNEERPGERRIYGLIFDPKYQRLLTGSSVIDAWPMTRAVEDNMAVPQTHERPVVQALYNGELNQLVTVCNESVIKVWDAETGVQVYQIADPHGAGIDVTVLALDPTGYRLLSGAYNGSINVFDFGAGHQIKSLPVNRAKDSGEDQSVLGLRYIIRPQQRYVLAAGWNNKIKLLRDGVEGHHLVVLHELSDVRYVQDTPTRQVSNPFNVHTTLPDIASRQNTSVSSKIFRKEHVLVNHVLSCLSQLNGSVILTGCSDGSLLFWDTDKSCIKHVCELPDDTSVDEDDEGAPLSENPRCVHFILPLIHSTRRPDPAYIQVVDPVVTIKRRLLGTREKETSSRTSTVHQITTNNRTKRSTNVTPASSIKPRHPNVSLTSRMSDGGHVGGHVEKKGGEDDDDPESHLIVVTYDPVIATSHEDGVVRFWDAEGSLLREVVPLSREHGTPLTCMCTDRDANILIAGDNKGYCVKWSVSAFLVSPQSEDQDLIIQDVYWHAHLTKVTTMAYIDSISAVVTGASDGSARLWSGRSGNFIGFFGQSRPFVVPAAHSELDTRCKTPILPYDITEGPLAPVRAMSARQRIRASQKREYPLIFNEDLWQPFKRTKSQFMARSQRTQPEDKKFFGALIKPRQEKLDSSTSGSMCLGAVFRALPVYRVATPITPRAPILCLPPVVEERRRTLTEPKLSQSLVLSKNRRVAIPSGRTSTTRASSLTMRQP